MRILICRPNLYLKDELTEYFGACGWESDLAIEPVSVYQALSQRAYDLILYYVSSLDDFAVIRYINEHYPGIGVIVSVEPGLGNAIENVRLGSYQSICSPIQFGDLGRCLNDQLDSIQNLKEKRHIYDNNKA